MDDAIADRPTKDKVKKRVSKETKKAKHKAYKRVDACNAKIAEVETFLHDKFAEVEKTHNEFVASINWKVDECTGLLKVRVTEQFVWDAIRTIEDRTKKEMHKVAESEMGKHDKAIKKLEAELKRVESTYSEKIHEARERMNSFDERFDDKLDMATFKSLQTDVERV
jgi:hypothetical protein